MKKVYFILFLCLISFTSFCQFIDNAKIGINIGTSSYNGDLVENNTPFKRMLPSFGLDLKYTNYSRLPYLTYRASLQFAKVYGDDKKNKDQELVARNLSFWSNIIQLSGVCEYHFLNHIWKNEIITEDDELSLLSNKLGLYSYGFNISPYVFIGGGIYHFNPYTYDDDNVKVFLKPLHTEGQGFADFPDRKNYSLYQLSVPFGGGLRFSFPNTAISINYEFTYNNIFTDYLDDVSKTYIAPERFGNNSLAASLAFRNKNVNIAKTIGDRRGFGKNNDVFYFNTIKVSAPLIDITNIFGGYSNY